MGKPFASSLFEDLDVMVSQIGNEMEDKNVKFSMKWKGQYSRIVFFAKITQLFIPLYLTTPSKMLLIPIWNTCALLWFSLTIDENTDNC